MDDVLGLRFPPLGAALHQVEDMIIWKAYDLKCADWTLAPVI